MARRAGGGYEFSINDCRLQTAPAIFLGVSRRTKSLWC
nr:MAG TPA: hypothetical protein [Caudoviricetes sp.]